MHPVAEELRRTFRALAAEPGEQESPAPAQPQISPWALWLLFALVRQVERQRWVSAVIVTKIGVDLDAISAAGSLGHPPGPQTGLVPDFPTWEYYLHGRGCCLSNRITGESIDVDFYDGISDWIDDFFYVGYLKSLKNPEPIERRLLELYPSTETVVLGFEELLEHGILQKHPDSKVVKPLDEFQDMADSVDTLNSDLESGSRRLVVAQRLGDWLLIADDGDQAGGRQACLAARQRYLESRFASEKSERLALAALCELVPNPSAYIARALQKAPCGTTSAALEIVSGRPDEDWSEPVYDLLCRANPNGDIPHLYTWTKCAEYLLGRGSHVDDIRARILKVGRRSLGDVAILGLEYFPDLAVQIFYRALRSDVPIDRITAAAALAVIDKPWCHTLLLEVLSESTDQELTSECRAALVATPNRQLHEAVAKWEHANPHEPEPGPFITMTEMSLRERDTRIQHEMEILHDRVIKLRNVNPPEPEHRPSRRRWWPF